MQLDEVELRHDDTARWYVKSEQVQVQFAAEPGVLLSREGPNNYRRGDALLTGSNADRWSVTRARFDLRYEPVEPLIAGVDGLYRNRPIPVLAKQMRTSFSIPRCRGGERLQGQPQDWLLQYAPGDWGVVEGEKFRRVYRLVS